MRPDGTTQVVLAGHPLYRFAADTAPGDVSGQGVVGTWYAAVSPSGSAVKSMADTRRDARSGPDATGHSSSR